jgi:hypothetical protein
MARKAQPERIPVETKLYAEKDSDLLEQIWQLQREKSYMRTFREAFRLILSLRRRETSVLFELFPWLTDGHMNTTQVNYIQYLIERNRELEQQLEQSRKPSRSARV